MIFPDDDETLKYTKHHQPYIFTNMAALNLPLPKLPMNFDHSYLPQDKCESELLQLAQCCLLKHLGKNMELRCRFEVCKFEACRRRRDYKIYEAIREWETDTIRRITPEDREMYVMGMNNKINRLEKQYEALPSTLQGQSQQKLKLFQLTQMAWRLKYVTTLKQSLSEKRKL